MKKYEIRKGVTAKDVRDSGLTLNADVPDQAPLIVAIHHGSGMMEMSFLNSAARVLVNAPDEWSMDGVYPENR